MNFKGMIFQGYVFQGYDDAVGGKSRKIWNHMRDIKQENWTVLREISLKLFRKMTKSEFLLTAVQGKKR